jgi:hypothetical protein
MRRLTVLVTLAVMLGAGVGAQQSARKYSAPAVAADEFWVSSVPLGAKVYATDDEAKLRSNETFVGRTPLLLKSRPRFIVLGFDTSDLKKRLSLARDPETGDFLDSTAHSFAMGLRQEGGRWGFTIFHEYRPDYARRKTLVALFQTRGADFDSVAALYPPGDNFRFDDSQLRVVLNEKPYSGFTPAQIDKAIQLLRRGGKVALESGANVVIVEILGANDIDVSKVFGSS